jgi:DDE superfamily endonuclease
LQPKTVSGSKLSYALRQRHRVWRFAADWCCVVATPTSRPTCRSATNSIVIGTLWHDGENVSESSAWQDCKTRHAPVGRVLFPPEGRVAVLAIATSFTEEHNCPRNGWTLDDIAATIINEAHAETVSRATICRVLQAADLKPHKSVYWLNSHDPEFEARAKEICQLYVKAPQFYQEGRLVICCDEKTGMQILQRAAPTQRVEAGKPEKREAEYIRLGTRCLMASFVVPTGEVVWDLGPTRTNFDFRAHVLRVAKQFDTMKKFDWIVDNLNTHCSLELCEIMAYLNKVDFKPAELPTMVKRKAFLSNPDHRHVFHYVPRHGSWLNQVELWFSVFSRQFLRRGDFVSVKDFTERLTRYLDEYNLEKAHPYRWTYTGEPLVRGTPFENKRREQQRGRAWFGSRPQLYERTLHKLRPYHRKPLAANL